MRLLTRALAPYDIPLLCGVAGLLVFGLLAIASVDLSRGVGFVFLQRQLIALAIGVGVAVVIARIHPEFFRATSRWWYVVGLALLVLVLFFGENIRGTRGWFSFAGFLFQPVEFMKVALVFTLARIIDRRGRVFQSALFFFGTGLIVAIPFILVMMQPDLGSALVLGALWLWLVLFVGTRRAYVLLFFAAAVVAALVAWFAVLQPYQKDRLISFVRPEADPRGAGYNVQQSIIAVGSGKFFGRGFGYGSQNQLSFLPERQTDFVFSVVGEELGFVGVLALLVCYAVVGWRLLVRATRCHDDFSLMVFMGVFGLWLIQVVVNVGGTLGVLPVTGITLPFVSYGGSSLVMNMALFGVVQSIAAHQTVR